MRSTLANVPINNPYDFTNIANGQLFKGRRADIAKLIGNICSGTHTVVFGLQRMGKTSLVEHVMKEVLPLKDELRNSTTLREDRFPENTILEIPRLVRPFPEGDCKSIQIGSIAYSSRLLYTGLCKPGGSACTHGQATPLRAIRDGPKALS